MAVLPTSTRWPGFDQRRARQERGRAQPSGRPNPCRAAATSASMHPALRRSAGSWWPALTLPRIPDRRSLRIGSETTQADVKAIPDGRSPRLPRGFRSPTRRPQFPAGSSGCACPSSRPRLGRPHAEPCSGGVAGRPVPGSRARLTNGTRKQQSGRRKQTGGRRRQHIRPPKSRRAIGAVDVAGGEGAQRLQITELVVEETMSADDDRAWVAAEPTGDRR